MTTAGNQVADINNQIQTYFRAQCSLVYVQKMHDWQEQYQRVRTAFQNFNEKLSQGHGGLNSAHEDASQMAQSMTVADTVAGALS